MVSKLMIGLVLVGCAIGQQQPVVYQQVFTNAVTVPQTSSTIYNVGQVGQQVYFRFTNRPAHTCSSPAPDSTMGLSFSYDNTNWEQFGLTNIIDQTSNSVSYMVIGTGVFPFVRAQITSFDTTNCQLNAWYTGTSLSPLVNVIQGNSPYGTFLTAANNVFMNNGTNPIAMGGMGSSRLRPLVTCDNSQALTVTAGTTTALTLPSYGTVHICGYQITLTAAGTAQLDGYTTVAGNVIGGACTTPFILSPLTPAFDLAAKTPLVVGNGLGQIFFTIPLSTAICLSATGGDAKVLLSYTVF